MHWQLLKYGLTARRIPERPPQIDPIRIELQHLVVELLGGCRRFGSWKLFGLDAVFISTLISSTLSAEPYDQVFAVDCSNLP
jgi:hypothetical protein